MTRQQVAGAADDGRKYRPGGVTGMQPFSLLAELGRCFAADSDRYFLWVPVFLAIGVACYFALSVEPPFWLAMFLPVVAGGLLWGVRLRPLAALCSAALFSAALGFAAAIVRADRVAAPVLEKPMSGTLVAEVISAERTEKGALSAVLAPISFAGLADSERPEKVRLNIRIRDAALRPGATVELRARLMPPPEPVLPRGFDFARQAWFEGLGAVGFAYTAPEERAPPSGAAAALTTLRMKIGERIRGVVGGTSGAVAAALINGERASIPDEVSEDLRAAGIYHVLSISGLHMVLFAGSLFWTVRAALALIPGLALRYPIKKWAAFIAILGATFYLTISGAAIATQRAWIMITLMFVAILLDRPALSMRNVALAAIVILLWRPESLVGASFQMSFAAVVALIAFYETEFARRWTMDAGRGGISSLPRTVLVYVLGIALTSIVAGAATGAIAGFHFNRVALYGLAGNMAAMPIVGFVVMPMALLALLLMPFGLDGPALWAMGKGVEAMLAIAHEVAGWGGADRLIPEASLSALLLVVFGALWLCLWRERWRFAGLVPIVLGFAMWNDVSRPDVLVDRDAALFAVRDGGGELALTASRPSYTAAQWLRHDADARQPGEAARSEHMNCDPGGCVYREPGRPVIAFPVSLGAVADDCSRADIMIAKIPVPYRVRKDCGAALFLDYFFFWRNGATTLHFDDDDIRIVTARQVRGDRPWVQRTRKDQ
ncbi:ComEC/Rec2 family competence protein [Parvibaculum sp.]|uniref:ComEC/Rec2 family competence protein n=1 Tax=Parvibaculum sp. TaxID=2024848 RepID=UPI0032F0632A